MKKIKSFMALMLLSMTSAWAVDPVTGIWSGTDNPQKRTGYSIEVQNNFMSMTMYSYAKNKATTDPTWYNAGGFLTQHNDGTASGTFDLYTVENNQLPGAKTAGTMDIVFKDRETATITWHNFAGQSKQKSTIKKFWFIGTGTGANAKRIAAVGDWIYTLFDINTGVSKVFVIKYFDPSKYPEKYKKVNNNLLIGSYDGKSHNVVKGFDNNGWDITLVRTKTQDLYFDEIGGGAEYGSGKVAVMARGVKPKNSDFTRYSTAVRITTVDGKNKKTNGRVLNANDSHIDIAEAQNLINQLVLERKTNKQNH